EEGSNGILGIAGVCAARTEASRAAGIIATIQNHARAVFGQRNQTGTATAFPLPQRSPLSLWERVRVRAARFSRSTSSLAVQHTNNKRRAALTPALSQRERETIGPR